MSTFINPIGSIDDADIYWKERELDGSHRAGNIRVDEYLGIDNTFKVKGKGGTVRHNGRFSEDNPVLAQLAVAKTNADRDWLYELAVKWELDRANLEEQRAYDDPSARIARERQAGIDSTLSGSSGAGSAGGASSVMPATQSNLNPSNFYDNANLAMQGVSLGFQGIGTLIDGAQKVMELVKGISTFGDFISQSKSATTIASDTATQAEQQTASNKLSLDSQRMSNQTQRYIQAGDIASLLPEGLTSDEDWNNHFDIFGVQDEQMRKLIRHIASSPEARSRYNEMIKKARQGEAFNFANTTEVLRDMEVLQVNTALAQNEIAFAQSQFERALANVRYSEEMASTVGETIKNEAVSTHTESQMRKERALKALESWRSIVDKNKHNISVLDEQIAKLQPKIDARSYSSYELARYNSLCVQRTYLTTMFDKQCSQFVSFLQNKYFGDFVNQITIDATGEPRLPASGISQSVDLNWASHLFNYGQPMSSDENLGYVEVLASKLIDIVF